MSTVHESWLLGFLFCDLRQIPQLPGASVFVSDIQAFPFFTFSFAAGLGCQLRETPHERQLPAGQPHRPQPLPALRLPLLPPLLLPPLGPI